MAIHSRNLRTNRKLQLLLGLLMQRGGRGATGREIADRCGCLNPGTLVSELRSGGWQVACDYEGKSPFGGKVYRYRLMGEAA